MSTAKYNLIIKGTIDPAQVQKEIDRLKNIKINLTPQIKLNKKSIDDYVHTWENQIKRLQANNIDIFKDAGVKDSLVKLQGLMTDFGAGGQTSVKDVKMAFDDLNTKIVETRSGMKNLTHDGMNFTTMLGTAIKKIAIWAVGTFAIYGTIQQIQKMIQNVKELDNALVELRKVTNLTEGALQNFTEQAFQMASSIGRTGTEVVRATAEFAKAGYEIKEALDLGETALVMMNVAEGIDNVEEATGALIAVLRGYNFEASESTRILDILNEVSNITATNFDDLADGLRRTSGTLSQTGTSVEELTGLLVGGFEPLRDMEMVSSGLVMISQRLRGIGEDGEKISGLAPKLQETFKTIANIDVENADGSLRSTYDILEDMARIWPTLNDQQRQYLGEQAAGNRQVKVLNAILGNWENVDKAIQGATDSAGSARVENEVFLDSIQGKMNKFVSTWQQLSKNTIDSSLIKSLVDIGTALLKLVDNVGLANIVLIAFSTFLSTKFTIAIPLVTKAIEKLAVGFKLAAGSAVTFSTVLSGALIGVAIVGAIWAFDKLNNSVVDTYQNFEKLKNVSQTNQDELSGLADEYQNLANKQEKNADDVARLLDIQTILNTKYDAAVSGVNIYTDAIDLNSQAIAENIEWMKRKAKQQANDFVKQNKYAYKEAKDFLSSPAQRPNTSLILKDQKELLDYYDKQIAAGKDITGGLRKQRDVLQEQIIAAENLIIEYEHYLYLVNSQTDFPTLKTYGPDQPDNQLSGVSEDLLQSMEDLTDFMEGSLDKAFREYDEAQTESAIKAALLRKSIEELSQQPTLSSEQLTELGDLQWELHNVEASIYATAAAYEQSTRVAIINLALQRIALAGLSGEAEITAYNMVWDLAEAWGVIGEGTRQVVQTMDSAFAMLMEGTAESADAAKLKIAELAAMATATSGDYYINFIVNTITNRVESEIGGYNSYFEDEYLRGLDGNGFTPPPTSEETRANYPGYVGAGGGGGGSDKPAKEVKEKEKTMKDLLALVINNIKKEKEAQRDALKEQLDSYKEIIDARKEILKTQQDELKYQDEISDKNKDIAKLQNELAILALDNSMESQARQLEIAEELEQAKEDLADTQQDHEFELQEEALDRNYEQYQEFIQKQLDEIENYLSHSGLIAQEALDMIGEKSPELYQALIEWNKEYGTGIDRDVTEAWNEAYAALEKYGDLVKALYGGDAEQGGSYTPESHHSGLSSGVVGGLKTPTNEVFTKLLAGEAVLQESDMIGILSRIPQIAQTISSMKSSSGGVFIEKLISIEGNVDKSVLPDLKKIAGEVLKTLDNNLSKRGYTRNVYSA